jgi:hypothetical protein
MRGGGGGGDGDIKQKKTKHIKYKLIKMKKKNVNNSNARILLARMRNFSSRANRVSSPSSRKHFSYAFPFLANQIRV